ncbi:Uncharacterized [Moorella glycerini]|uniref:Uncharacterized protein n=1 Tax=Neomoorella stamsii TaxID=1266720 RepID=A0A9X7J5F1_9FIRM|nr:hypothetical protein MOST_10140 [Moorella stamsii]CEP69134.1 Uncharacterized [Moorella glycerini]
MADALAVGIEKYQVAHLEISFVDVTAGTCLLKCNVWLHIIFFLKNGIKVYTYYFCLLKRAY